VQAPRLIAKADASTKVSEMLVVWTAFNNCGKGNEMENMLLSALFDDST
jgi:hypothetical protein